MWANKCRFRIRSNCLQTSIYRYLQQSTTVLRAGVSQADLVYYYQAVIRPVLEYACPVWHTSITGQQSKQLDSIHRQACQIILNNRTHSDTCTILGLRSLPDRRHKLCQRLFQQLARSTDSCMRYLLPDMHDSIITNRLRSANKFPLIFAKTNKFKNSFIWYGLSVRDTLIFFVCYTVYVVLY